MSEGRSTPRWLLEGEVGLCPCGCIGRRRRGGFVQKTIAGGANVIRQAIYADELAERRGLLQRIDPRVKIVTLVGLLIVAALARNVEVLLAMYALTIPLAVASKLPVGFFVRRVWLFIPIFTGIIVIPAMFSFITPGNIVVPLGDWFGNPVGLTEQGLRSAALLVTRVATSISLVVLLTLTTPWAKLLSALRALFVPRIFILILGMAYRYIFLLLNSVTDMYTARTARAVSGDRDGRAGRRFVAASAGALFGKSHALSEEVYLAMLARGFRGDARTLEQPRIQAIDVLWTVGCAAAAVAILMVEGALGA